MADYRPQTAAYDKEITLWTYQDAVEHLLDFFRIDRKDNRQFRLAMRAVDFAYRDMPYKHRWQYYDRQFSILTEASQATGTVGYDHTGGTYERQLTMSGATWPANIRHYQVTINDRAYRVEDKKSTTVITLEQANNPGADIAAGNTYIAFRDAYPLPVDFRKVGRVFDEDNEYEIPIITDNSQMGRSIFFYDSPGSPWKAALRNTGEFFGSMDLVFSPPPDAARVYKGLYEAAPLPLLVERYSPTAATITTDGTTTVVGDNTAFDSAKHIGTVLRLSGNTQDVPTGKYGDRDDLNNPYKYQRVIQSVTNATTVVVDTLIPTLTAVKMTISSPIDIEQGAMFTAFIRMCEAEFATMTSQKTRNELKAASMQAMIYAMENDSRAPYSGSGARYYDKFSRALITTDDS